MTFPISADGFPCSTSRRNRSETPASSATSSCVSLRTFRCSRTNSPREAVSTVHPFQSIWEERSIRKRVICLILAVKLCQIGAFDPFFDRRLTHPERSHRYRYHRTKTRLQPLEEGNLLMSESKPVPGAKLGYIDNLAQGIEYSPNATASAMLMRAEGVLSLIHI